MLSRIVVLSLFSFLGITLFLTALCGRKYAKTRDSQYLASHTVCAKSSFILMIVAVASVELLKQIEGSIGYGLVRSLHLSFAIPFFLLFVFAFFLFTGIRTQRYHRCITYPCLISFAVALIAGAAMLLGIAS